MKGLILKDLYNISHNAKSMFFILLVFAAIFIPSSGIQSYLYTCAALCSMMVVTTFSFDERSNWAAYAMIMPISKKDLVAGKYIALLIFSGIGVALGIIAGTAGSIIAGAFVSLPDNMIEAPLLLIAITALAISNVFGGISIPLTLKFGAEKGRILILASFFIPAAICYIGYRLFTAMGIAVTDELISALLYCSPVIALIWNYVMFKISCVIFIGKEL